MTRRGIRSPEFAARRSGASAPLAPYTRLMGATQRAARDEGWPRSAEGVAYPPEPWSLAGELLVAVHLVPSERMPPDLAAAMPKGARIVRVGRRTVVGVALVHYGGDGVLAYEELLVAVPVMLRGRVVVVIPQIWVTSEASRAGGRELWGIPKGIADVRRRHPWTGELAASVRVDGVPTARVHARLGNKLLPGRVRMAMPTAQRLDGREFLASNSLMVEVRAVHGEWTFAVDGPLGYLAGEHPWLQVALTRAAIVFGRRVRRTREQR